MRIRVTLRSWYRLWKIKYLPQNRTFSTLFDIHENLNYSTYLRKKQKMLRNILITNNSITLLAVTITFTSKQNHLKTKISNEANLIFFKNVWKNYIKWVFIKLQKFYLKYCKKQNKPLFHPIHPLHSFLFHYPNI